MRGFDYYKVTTVTQRSLPDTIPGKSGHRCGRKRSPHDDEGPAAGAEASAARTPDRYQGDQRTGLHPGREERTEDRSRRNLSHISSSPLIGEVSLLSSGRSGCGSPDPECRHAGGNLCSEAALLVLSRKAVQRLSAQGGGQLLCAGRENQYHAILGGENCYMVFPSDMAPALTALNARVEIGTPKETG